MSISTQLNKTLFSVFLDSTELDASSVSFSSNADSDNTGSIGIEGFTDLEFISDNQETGVITIYKTKQGVETEILTASIDKIGINDGPTVKTISLTLADIVFSGSIPSSFAVDDIVSNRQLSDGLWSFTLPEYEQGYQSGMTVSYLGVERYIDSVSVSWSGGTSRSVTLKEGLEGDDEESEVIEEGLPNCTYRLSINEPKTFYWSTSCSLGYDTIGAKISPKGYSYDLMLFKCAQFEITSEGQYRVEFITYELAAYLRPGLNFTTSGSGLAIGTEFDIVQGVYTPFTNPAPTVKTFRGHGFFLGTLTPGIYTANAELYVDRAADLAWMNWLAPPFFILVRD